MMPPPAEAAFAARHGFLLDRDPAEAAPEAT